VQVEWKQKQSGSKIGERQYSGEWELQKLVSVLSGYFTLSASIITILSTDAWHVFSAIADLLFVDVVIAGKFCASFLNLYL